MDVKCRYCGEPFDLDEFHDVAEGLGSTFQRVYAEFRRKGCEAIRYSPGGPPGTHNAESMAIPQVRARASIAGELMDLLGDDVDGAAAMIEDFGL